MPVEMKKKKKHFTPTESPQIYYFLTRVKFLYTVTTVVLEPEPRRCNYDTKRLQTLRKYYLNPSCSLTLTKTLFLHRDVSNSVCLNVTSTIVSG